MTEPIQGPGPVAKRAVRILDLLDNTILAVVALGTIVIVLTLLHDLVLDFIMEEEHSFTHLMGELLFVLIIMELYRQVLRQIMRQAFSLQPFMTIGVIVCVRAILLIQMKLGTGEIDWMTGAMVIFISALAVLLLMAASYLYHKTQ